MRRIGMVSVVMLAMAGGAGAQTPTLRIRADLWCPYNCVPGAPSPGFMVEITERILKTKGIALDYQTLPWARALAEAAMGGIDGVIGASPSDARTLVPTTQPMARSETVAIVRKGEAFTYTGPNALGERRLATITNYSYGEALDAWIEKHKANRDLIQAGSGDEALPLNLRKLGARRVDVVLEDRAVAERMIRAMNLADAVEIVTTGAVDDLFVALSPKHPRAAELAKLLGDGVIELRKSGALAEILAKYQVKDWSP